MPCSHLKVLLPQGCHAIAFVARLHGAGALNRSSARRDVVDKRQDLLGKLSSPSDRLNPYATK